MKLPLIPKSMPILLFFLLGGPVFAADNLNLGPEEIVPADGAPLTVIGYSVPSYVDWNSDGLPDLVIGEGGGLELAKVRVYLNAGASGAPAFAGFFYAQSLGADLVLASSGCMGIYPRVVYWDDDARKDLLVGMADGRIRIYLNTATDDAPAFDAGAFLQVGPVGLKTDINVGGRATPNLVDWNGDGLRDLVSGSYGGKIDIFINAGLDAAPDYPSQTFAPTSGGDLVVYGARSSPVIGDFDGDFKKDILTGNTNGQLLLYSNLGTDPAPLFAGYESVAADSVPIDVAGSPRSRPSVCDWTGDGRPDVLIGAADGMVRLYQGQPDLSPVVATPPAGIRVLPPWPNPFNPCVNVAFEMRAPARVRVNIYDLSGRRVRNLANRIFPFGTNRLVWRGDDDTGHALPSGVYVIHLDTGRHQSGRKLYLVR
jgi:hypothetical protein